MTGSWSAASKPMKIGRRHHHPRYKEKPSKGDVVAVGSGTREDTGQLQPIDVGPGGRIVFGNWSSTEVHLHGQDPLIMKEGDVMDVLGREQTANTAA